MHQSGDMDKFNDYRQGNVLFGNSSRRSTRQQCQARAETLGRATEDVLDMLAKARIKTADLVCQRDFHPRQFSRNGFQQFQEIAAECAVREAPALNVDPSIVFLLYGPPERVSTQKPVIT